MISVNQATESETGLIKLVWPPLHGAWDDFWGVPWMISTATYLAPVLVCLHSIRTEHQANRRTPSCTSTADGIPIVRQLKKNNNYYLRTIMDDASRSVFIEFQVTPFLPRDATHGALMPR